MLKELWLYKMHDACIGEKIFQTQFLKRIEMYSLFMVLQEYCCKGICPLNKEYLP